MSAARLQARRRERPPKESLERLPLSAAGQRQLVRKLRQRRKRAAGAAAAADAGGEAVDVSGVGRIIVAGGGIGGAAVAVALQSRGFDVLVLEADASLDSRKQGCGHEKRKPCPCLPALMSVHS